MEKKMTPVIWKAVDFDGGFWKERQELNLNVTLNAEYEQLVKTGRLEALKQQWRPGQPGNPHHYWDSDVAKWIETAAYTLSYHADDKLEKKIDTIINTIEKAQFDDGYFNTYFTIVEPGKRWTNLHVMHELYCAGHLIEAAVAYFESTGKRKFLYIMIAYADYIDSVFGPEEDKIHGYPGHEEIELALVKLYRVTGEKRYLALSKYFIDERGKTPNFFEQEARQRNEDPDHSPIRESLNRNYLAEGPYALFQAHAPVCQQKTAEGHAVRAMYLYAAMADAGIETGDSSLLDACKVLWSNVTEKRMSITGGVGTFDEGERFTYDYNLPNEAVYNETCASIGLIFWAHRMLLATFDAKYADIIEQTLFNGVLSGVSLSGDRFFYSNPLAVSPGMYSNRIIRNPRLSPQRQSWFEVSCCPPNLARLVASLGGYFYSLGEKGIYIHLYGQNSSQMTFKGTKVGIRQHTEFPWDGKIRIELSLDSPLDFALSVRIPGWCSTPSASINGTSVSLAGIVKDGFAGFKRLWQSGDYIDLAFPMEPVLVEAHPRVRQNCGRAAIKRGPLVYCLEEVDNGDRLWDVSLSENTDFTSTFKKDLLGGIVTVKAKGKSRKIEDWDGTLYSSQRSDSYEREITAIPYFAWSNRNPGEMIVWLRKE
ncbi:beta-L-arabinofuranosidase domain-containing protein [Marispirochaeta sp.]|uniref:glycoside hydrolase family 127 protein n=1 Tax=Marispirochaeta sp. TaxID=2038653 RepID=UPI0029C63055|nr:beta-L-arabinofuranosidase domain-containing protein [Marispirochaeta sp.]